MTSTSASAADCAKSGLADAATKAVQAVAQDNTYRIDDVKCDAGWAVTSGLWSSTANPDMGAPTTVVFQRQRTQWVNRDNQKVCGHERVDHAGTGRRQDSPRTLRIRLFDTPRQRRLGRPGMQTGA